MDIIQCEKVFISYIPNVHVKFIIEEEIYGYECGKNLYLIFLKIYTSEKKWKHSTTIKNVGSGLPFITM